MTDPRDDGFTHGERRRSAVADVVQAWRRGRACGARQEIASAYGLRTDGRLLRFARNDEIL